MKILEVKNNLVKIAYDVNDNLALADFVIIEDSNTPYVAQVMNIKADTSGNFAIVKLIFTFNDEGILKNYNGTAPSVNASISKLPTNELLDVIPKDNPIFIGKLAQKEISLYLDKSMFDNNLLICSDNITNTTKLISNFIRQLDEKTVIIDPEGQLEFDDKISAGIDFKIPLGYEAINFIYENDLEDVDPINKAIIQDIFIEVQKYINTLPEKYIPFDTFVDVVDSQYKATKIPELILLKNKLLKYKELNIFAQDTKDVLSLSIAIEQAITPVIDLSNLPANLQKEIISYTYTVLNNINENIYVFVKANNDNISKKLLKRYITKDNVNSVVICPHEFKYIQEVKEIAQNVIFFAPLTVTHDFASYNTYLSKLNLDEFVIYGAHTQNIPFIAEISDIPEQSDDDSNEKEVQEEYDEEEPVEEVINSVENEPENIEIVEDYQDSMDDDNIIEALDNYEEPIIDENKILEDEIIEEEPIEVTEPIEEPDEDVINQVAKDVDKVFYEKLPDEDEDFPAETEEDELSEDDLNMIEDLSEEDIQLAGDEENISEEEVPVVPIYPADDIEESTQTFEAGDRVSTVKYGEGVVEKMIKYGNKMLCSIDFPSIGRRLLDPAMTEITKLD